MADQIKSKHIFLSILGVILLIVLFLGIDYSSLLWKRFINPKKEDVRRAVFEQTRSYNEAKIQDLIKYRLEFLKEEDPIAKKALRSTILHMFANYDENKLPLELRNFLQEIKYNSTF